MAALRVPTLKNIISSPARCLRAPQRRWAQVHDVRFLATQAPDRVIEKYREKLARKAQEEGLRDINELKQAYKDKIENYKKEAFIPLHPTTGLPTPPPSPSPSFSSSSTEASAESQTPFNPPPPPTPQASPQASPPPAATQIPKPTPAIKTLSSYLDLPKTLTLPPTEISQIWRLRHASNPLSLCATIPLPLFQRILATARQHPFFILPLPKENAPQEIHFMQWTFPAPDTVVVLFTHLAEYKLRGEYSQAHTTVTHHLEIVQEKGIVLVQGQVMEGRGVSVKEAQWLVLCLQKFYGEVGGGEEARRRRELLEMFGRGDERFRVEDLVEEAEKIV